MCKSLCVFCGSSVGNSPVYAQAAERLGQYLAEKQIRLVFGGGHVGLMGIVAESVLAAGGEVTGVIPRRIHEMIEPVEAHPRETLEVVDDMHARKSRMYALSDGFLAMPGGIGTIEEFFETFTWLQLGYHLKPVGLFNIGGFYDQLLVFLGNMVTGGFFKQAHLDKLIVDKNYSSLVDSLISERPVYTAKL